MRLDPRPFLSRSGLLRLTALACAAGGVGVDAWAQYDPLSGAPSPAPASSPAAKPPAAGAPYDRYGPKPVNAPAQRDRTRGVTKLIEVVDGTPRYELAPDWPISRSQAAESGMVSINISDGLPVGGGKDSPVTTGPHGGLPVDFDYVVEFWRQYPNAKERAGHDPKLGKVYTAITDRTDKRDPAPPPAIKADLDRKARAFLDAFYAYPFIQRSEGVMTKPQIHYRHDKDPSGTEVWGFRLSVGFGVLGVGGADPVQSADGRWESGSLAWSYADICVNCWDKLWQPSGRYRGFQMMSGKVVIDTLNKDLWVKQFKTGEGDWIPNPELYDRARPPTDIQILTLDAGWGEAPDNANSRATAALFLTDWKPIVDRLNSPGSPRAD